MTTPPRSSRTTPPGTPRPSAERLGFAALVLLSLAPMLGAGLWRPLASAWQLEVDALGLGVAAVAAAAAALLARSLLPKSGLWLAALPTLPSALLLARSTGELLSVSGVLLGVAALVATLTPALLQRLPPALDGLAAGRRGIALCMALLGVLAVSTTTRLSAFMADASRTELSLAPDVPFLVHHSCLTAYVEGAVLANARVDNLYDAARWPDLNGTAGAPPSLSGPYAPFPLDAFAYPPQFLLLPQATLLWLPDFAAQRTVWFALHGLFIALGLGIVATWLGGRAGLRALMLSPLVWVSPPLLFTLQTGNAHAVVVVIAMLSLVAFSTRRPALGGALLAFAILAKVSPGLLVLVLLIRGRFVEVLWTAAFGVGFTLVTLAVVGPAPVEAFLVYELPRLGSGEALKFLAENESIPINLAPFALPFKLAFLGVDIADPWAVARTINRIFTVALVGATLWAAREDRGPRATAVLWAAVLTLGALRSPLAPGYVVFSLLWLLALRAEDVRSRWGAAGLAALWFALSWLPPFPLEQLVPYSLVQQAVLLGAAVLLLLRPPAPGPAPCAPASVPAH